MFQPNQKTRHARRIYVGNLPENFIDEEALKTFLNTVIAKGLGLNSYSISYVLSMYINEKKGFAFVELPTMELTTACLCLDGILYMNSPLKILRANEYKPGMIPQSLLGPPIVLNTNSFQFGNSSNVPHKAFDQQHLELSTATLNIRNMKLAEKNSMNTTAGTDLRLDSIIQLVSSVAEIPHGSVALIGYPYNDNYGINSSGSNISNSINGSVSTGTSTTNELTNTVGDILSCSQTPKKLRKYFRKYQYGMLYNPEFNIDIGGKNGLKIVDVGDVLAGKTRHETKQHLYTTVKELILAGAITFVVGGSSDVSYFNGLAALTATGAQVGMVMISAQLSDIKILKDYRDILTASQGSISTPPNNLFTTQAIAENYNNNSSSSSSCGSSYNPNSIQSNFCNGKYIRFGVQGSQCTSDQVKYVEDNGGRIVWLNKHIRRSKVIWGDNVQNPSELGKENNKNHQNDTSQSSHDYTLLLFRECLQDAARNPISTQPTNYNIAAAADNNNKDCQVLTPSSVSVSKYSSSIIASSTSTVHTSLSSHPHHSSILSPPILPLLPPSLSSPSTVSSSSSSSSSITPSLTPIIVCLDVGSLSSLIPGCNSHYSNTSSQGLTIDEILDMMFICGMDPNVILIDISEFCPDTEDSRCNMLVAELFYRFILGVTIRKQNQNNNNQNNNNQNNNYNNNNFIRRRNSSSNEASKEGNICSNSKSIIVGSTDGLNNYNYNARSKEISRLSSYTIDNNNNTSSSSSLNSSLSVPLSIQQSIYTSTNPSSLQHSIPHHHHHQQQQQQLHSIVQSNNPRDAMNILNDDMNHIMSTQSSLTSTPTQEYYHKQHQQQQQQQIQQKPLLPQQLQQMQQQQQQQLAYNLPFTTNNLNSIEVSDENPAWYEDGGFLTSLDDNNQFNLKNESGFFTTGHNTNISNNRNNTSCNNNVISINTGIINDNNILNTTTTSTTTSSSTSTTNITTTTTNNNNNLIPINYNNFTNRDELRKLILQRTTMRPNSFYEETENIYNINYGGDPNRNRFTSTGFNSIIDDNYLISNELFHPKLINRLYHNINTTAANTTNTNTTTNNVNVTDNNY